MKDKIKKLLACNTYLNAKIYSTLSRKTLAEMKALCLEAAEDDSIQDVSWLKQFRRDIEKHRRKFYTTDCNWSNAHIYGIWNSLFGDLNIEPIYTPSVEHGLIFHNQIFNDLEDTARAACVTFGEFRKNIIQQYWDRPIFCVGPYIQYAKSFYDEHRIKVEKARNGRTLLVFPMHSTNNSELSVDIINYCAYLKRKQGEYETILVNTFWWNVNDPLTEALQAEGYRIVSAGFRDDIMFMRRLKTLILLADVVVGDSIGTHVGYCINCSVPFSYEPFGTQIFLKTDKENRDIDFVQMHMSKIANEFYHSQIITREQISLCKYYWGNGITKTREQLKNIALLCRDAVRYTGGVTRKYHRYFDNLLRQSKEM